MIRAVIAVDWLTINNHNYDLRKFYFTNRVVNVTVNNCYSNMKVSCRKEDEQCHTRLYKITPLSRVCGSSIETVSVLHCC